MRLRASPIAHVSVWHFTLSGWGVLRFTRADWGISTVLVKVRDYLKGNRIILLKGRID